jgi:hypothetical protein
MFTSENKRYWIWEKLKGICKGRNRNAFTVGKISFTWEKMEVIIWKDSVLYSYRETIEGTRKDKKKVFI